MNAGSPSRAIIDLSAYAHNLSIVRSLIPPQCGIMAVVKTNAYGLGNVPIARRAVAEGVRMLGVTTVDEGMALRKAGIEAPIVVLVQPHEEALPAVVEHNLRVMVSDVALAERLGELARRTNRVVPVHCKIDTGMGRQGFASDKAIDILRSLTRISPIDIEGIATHFADADGADDAFTAHQVWQFRQLLKQAEKAGIPFEMAHAATSAAIVNYPESAFDMVRPGLMTYGVWPTRTQPNPMPLRPVLRWESRVVLVKEIKLGASIGYGRTYTTDRAMRTAVVPVGYADGYRYAFGNRAHVLIGGKRCPVRGSVSMDQIVVDISAAGPVETGDAVTLIGTDGSESVTVRELADIAQTVPHDILAGLAPRVAREYVE
jgi:alanine racemase